MTRKQFELECKAIKATLKPRVSSSGGRRYYSDADTEEIKRISQIGRDLHLSDQDIADLLGIGHGFIVSKLGHRTQPYQCHKGSKTYIKRAPVVDDQPSPENMARADHCLALARLANPDGTEEEIADLATHMGELLFREIGHAPSRATTAPEVTQEAKPEPTSSRGHADSSKPFDSVLADACNAMANNVSQQVARLPQEQGQEGIGAWLPRNAPRIPSDARKLTLQQVLTLADAIRPMLGEV